MRSVGDGSRWRGHISLDVGTSRIRVAVGAAPFSEHPSCAGGIQGVRDGVVVDAEAVAHILEPHVHRARRFGLLKPLVLACAPSDARQDERERLVESIAKAGARSVQLVPEPLAAAVGAGLDISSPYAQMIVDVGEGVTDCAVIRSSVVCASRALRTGCQRMRGLVLAALREHGDVVGDEGADLLLTSSGLRAPREARGAVPAEAIRPVVEEIAGTAAELLQEIPHQWGCEIIEGGICVTGGGALIPGVRERIEQRTGIHAAVPPNPRATVIEGGRAMMPVLLLCHRL